MRALPRNFSTYAYIGVFNTLIHWSIFLALYSVMSVRQSIANVCAFAVAATFSFHANARYTFKRTATPIRYLSFIGFMALLSFATGWLGDWLALPGVVTLAGFSAVSLVAGYLYTRYVVFRGNVSGKPA
ncbi:GtrA family protein [Pseudomonas gingeri]|uniref:Bactoprenol-linked glucose translocase n=1 Tax=Pseudomonas gingeri TaxID=117681 RepID=A0A7Y8CL68_9PSED|nr:GtrA family protein [Pseudomonas gingeri]NWC34295.1 GtrA family protein [Pseudomonas gingeri]NWD07214.1 GtrA family protein [Pseudomonas gingeri]NWD52826.1 GtrA family protein [Pseudomonas gingeri]NWE32555.1 GtrA family protein [Pseudomonas gingeri]